MNQNTRTLRSVFLTATLFAFAVCLGCILTAPAAHAQPAADQSAAVVNAAPATTDWLASLLTGFVGSHPWASAVLLAMGLLRSFFKPLMAGIESYVKSTPSTADDEFIAKAQHSPAFKVFAWCLDFFGSVKIGPQFTAKPIAAPTTPPPAA